MLSALWPGEVIPRTPSQTADWLEVAAGRFEAWKASAARAGARRALEFVRAWYPGLDLTQLATWRQEANEELEAVRPAIIQRASAIAEYTDTSAFVPELNDDGVALSEEWFGMNPADGEDSAEEIDSSDEGEEEEEEDSEDAAPDGGAADQPQLDRASSNEARASAPPAAGDDQAETRQPATPPASTAVSTNLPSSPVAPLARAAVFIFAFLFVTL